MDEDFILAMQLQEEEYATTSKNKENEDFSVMNGGGMSNSVIPKPGTSGGPSSGQNFSRGPENLSLIDPQWEVMDPNPNIHSLFLQFNERFFWGRLAGVEVRWSPRMTLCAGLCCYEGRAGYCSVRLSVPLLKLRPRSDLIETLLHEMIHAYLFVTQNNKDHDGHGPEFHKHMYRINKEAGTKISVYHNFHDEVDHHRQHWWRCDGICRSKPPYFGYVKRSMNRAPHPRDPWWEQHRQTCGGTYTKVKEPEDYGKKKGKQGEKAAKGKASTSEKGSASGSDIRNFFSGNSISKKGGKSANPEPPVRKEISSSGVLSVKGIEPTSASDKGINNFFTGRTSPKKDNKGEPSKGKIPGVESSVKNKDTSNGIFSRKDTAPNSSVRKTDDSNKAKSQGSVKGIHGFTQDYNIKVHSQVTHNSQQTFPGQGKSLGWNEQRPGKIVRRIPGIGIIESARPCDNKRKSSEARISDSDSDTDDILIGLRTKKKSRSLDIISQRKLDD